MEAWNRGAARWRGLLLPLLLLFSSGFVSRSSSDSLWYQDLCSYKWEAVDNKTGVSYTFKLCSSSPDTPCGSNAAVCVQDLGTKQSQSSVGELSLLKPSDGLLVFSTAQNCQSQSTKVQSSISFQCGKTMGTPEFITESQCVHYFEWRTYAACKKGKFKPLKEVPCYVFDSDGKKHDLNPLIKPTGGYLVDDSDDDTDFYINVCRSLGNLQNGCDEGSAACLTNRDGSISVGKPAEPLKLISNDRLSLRYESETESEQCGGHKPAVTITFICPSQRQQGSDPKLTAKTNCRFEVEWVTEFACHRDYLESSNCKLTNQQHDISIDLTQLTQSSGDKGYTVKAKVGSDDYQFYLNVCGETSAGGCSDVKGFISSCQVKTTGGLKKVAGRYQNQTLRYSDGDLTLLYPGGDSCSSGFQRMTIINFECNAAAGNGLPVFTGEVDCTYYFNWQTAAACFSESKDLLCRVTDGKKHYDLSPLTRYTGSDTPGNWEVVDANNPKADKRRFYLNVCNKLINQRESSSCPKDAAICAVGAGKQKTLSLGKFLSSPQKDRQGNDLRLIYTDGGECKNNRKITSIITLKCKPGDVERPPVLRSISGDGCLYEFEWQTATACVLSKVNGDECKVEDFTAGISFDLSPLRKANGGYYNVSHGDYQYFINVCGAVKAGKCPQTSGACQVAKSDRSWNLGEFNSRLSYYDGMINLDYLNGTPYNNKQQTKRSTHIFFLCDRDAGAGEPEFQTEDVYTYNFKWYTSYACPERPQECVVTDPGTLQQYDLSSLSKSTGTNNWEATDSSDPSDPRTYYINVCRPLCPVPGCDRLASVCQIKYDSEGVSTQKVAVSNMGVAKKGPVIETEDQLMLEYTDGSVCEEDGVMGTFSTRIHFICARGHVSSGPRFLTNENCTVNFIWDTEAACAISTVSTNQTCSLKNPNTGFEFNLLPLFSKTGYQTSANGKDFIVNICGEASDCGKNKVNVSGCVKEDDKTHSFVGVEKSLQFSSNGLLTLTYRGEWNEDLGTKPTFTISFVCDQNATGNTLKLINETMSTGQHTQHDVLFEFSTPLACEPAPVECRITDSRGNEYDLSDLSLKDEPFFPLDTSEQASNQKFFLSVCKPLPPINGCPMGVIGACGQVNGRALNLGYVQSSLQARADGSISIVYLGGDKCGADGRYSTRIIFQCDDSPGSPMFDRQDGCEYVFLWRTSEACPVKRVQGSDCKVKDPRNGYEYNLMPLAGKDYSVNNNPYTYHFAVCGPIQGPVCPHESDKSVASCQAENSKHRNAGLSNQNLLFDDGVIMINYTHGETCHKIYERSTAILFSCDHSQNPGKPLFIKETPDCTYLFEWHTALACPPFKTISCSYSRSSGSSYDLSSLALHDSNWVVVADTNQRYYINVCKSLVPQSGSWGCPSGAAACVKTGDHYFSIGEVQSELQWDGDKLKLNYTDGAPCPGKERNRTTIIRFTCDHTKVDSKPTFLGEFDCEYSFVWFTAAACPLNSTEHEDCKVSNPLTGHLFDLNQLSKDAGYTVYDSTNKGKRYQLNVCSAVKSSTCPPDSGVCITNTTKSIGGGKANRKLVYKDQVVELIYEGGDPCEANPLLRHKSIISFICKSSQSEPELVDSNPKTCTHFFSWHTHLVCEQKVSCLVSNGTNLIDLSPLINLNGYYTATDEDVDKDDDKSPDYYINICQPLNSIPGVKCPPGAAVCMDPSDGEPIDIGRVTSLPQYVSATNEVIIEFNSSTPCDAQLSSNYTSRIIFTCQRSTELGSPVMMRKLDCTYVFEWATPVVCPETVSTQGCKLQVSQLKYTFDLTRLSGDVQVSSQSGIYHLNVCGNVAVKECKNSPVCLVSGGASASSYGISQAMSLSYSREDRSVVLKYGGGDPCPPVTKDDAACHFPFIYLNKSYSECISDASNPGQKWCATTANYDKDSKRGFCTEVSDKKQSTILFTCDRSAGHGKPQLLSETRACSSSFQWRTDAICPPKKMECKLVSKHQTYDLRTLSSLTEPWKFSNSMKGDAYFMNLCQGIHGGLTDCPEGAAVCRRLSNGKTQSLGQLHTQSMGFKDGKIQVNYTLGDVVCEKNSNPAKTVVQLSCGNTVGHPRLLREDLSTCEIWVEWETRAACAVKQQEVEMLNGTIRLSPTGAVFNLGSLYSSLHKATGDIRGNGDSYIYHIQLSGITDKSLSQCLGANICQVKKDATYCRKIGSSDKAKYYIKGDNLDILVPSESVCGRDKSKTVSSTILFHCSPSAGEGIPEFLLETDGCQYLFVWHTSTVCNLFNMSHTIDENNQDNARKSQALGVVLTLLLVVMSICLLFLLLHKRERREVLIQKITSCCKRRHPVSYKYSKVNTDEDGCEDEMEWLMEEVETPPHGPHENGHITTKPVSADALRSFSLDEQDSEEEVLSIPGVRVHSGRAPSQLVRKSESDEDLMGLDDRGRKSGAKASSRTPRRAHEDADDSDEDLLRV